MESFLANKKYQDILSMSNQRKATMHYITINMSLWQGKELQECVFLESLQQLEQFG
jgi:hypothetical protein